MNKEISLFLDYRDQFYFSTKYRGAGVDVQKLKTCFRSRGYELVVKHFFEIDFRKENYENKWVLYQSSEDPGLFYKDYIEDVVFALELQGARLLPSFRYFRAHHNKVFMELLRDLLPINDIKSIVSRGFGTYEEYVASGVCEDPSPVVIKPGSGTRSAGVELLNTAQKKKRSPYKLSRSFTFDNLKFLISKIRTGKPYTPMSNNRRKFILQNLIPGLSGDYKILAYGDKYYALFRANRDGDFRASGSGKLHFEVELLNGLLDFAKSIYTKFDTPFMSLDVGSKDGKYHLFEFQCISFGQYTLEKSRYYFTQSEDGSWDKVFEKPDLEREITSSVLNYIERRK